MAVTPASLATNRPEFSSVVAARPTLVANFIAKAERVTDAEVWGDSYDDGVELLVCDMLARSPFARELRLVADDNTTVYRDEWTGLARKFGGAFRLYPE